MKTKNREKNFSLQVEKQKTNTGFQEADQIK